MSDSATKASAPKKRSRPSAKQQSGMPHGVRYNWDQMPEIRPLFPEKLAKEGAEKAEEIVLRWSAEKLDRLKPKALKRKISKISSDYWFNLKSSEAFTSVELKRELKPIQKANKRLLDLLDNASGFVLMKQLPKRNLETAAHEQADDVDSLREHLRALDKLCKSASEATGRTGAPEKIHIKEAVRALAELWSDLSGKEFVRSYLTSPGHGSLEEFVSSSPRFVFELLKAIDNDVTHREVRTALKDVLKSSSMKSKKTTKSARISDRQSRALTSDKAQNCRLTRFRRRYAAHYTTSLHRLHSAQCPSWC